MPHRSTQRPTNGMSLRFEETSRGGQIRAVERDDEIFVETVWVPAAHRSHGLGTRLLERVLLLADALGKPVRLEVRPLGTTGADVTLRLVSWYRAFGFEVVGSASTVPTLVRPPRSAARAQPAGLD